MGTDWNKQVGLVQTEAKELLFIGAEQDRPQCHKRGCGNTSIFGKDCQRWKARNVLKKWPRERLSVLIRDLSDRVGFVTICITCNSNPDDPIMK